MKPIINMLVLLLTALLVSGCVNKQKPQNVSETETPQEEKQAISYPLMLRVGYSTGEDDPRGVALQYMKEVIEKETDGQIILEIHPSGEMGSDDQLIAGLISGNVDITVSSAGNYALYAPKVGVSALPFLFEDFRTAWDFIDSETMKTICSELEPYNIHVLVFFDNGFRCVTTSDKPVKSVADMAGLNIRTPDNQIVMETMSELGARPRSYPFAQLRQALIDGDFDAQENPIPVIYNNSLYEVQKYLSITNHSYDAMPLTIRQDVWEQLPGEYQTIILKAAEEAQTMDREMVAEQTVKYVALLEGKGMQVDHPELTEFVDATRGVMEVFENVYGKELLEIIIGMRAEHGMG